MIIVHELQQLAYGGVERIIANLAKFDKENKHVVAVYTDGPFRAEMEAAGATVVIAPKTGEEPFDMEADIIHIHSGGALSEFAETLGKEFPIVETIHSPIRSPIRAELIAQRVGVTEAVSRINTKCITIHNGIDIDAMVPKRSREEIRAELGIQADAVVVGRLGRIGKDKSLEEWILTCYGLQNKGVAFVPIVVGGEAADLDGYIGKLKLMAASLPVGGIVWAGHRSDVADVIQAIDIFLYPSPTEGFGLVFAEAMLAGAVVVTYDNEVTREVAGGYAILTESSIEGLERGVMKAMNQNVRDELVPIAQEWVRDQFSAERMAADYHDLYARVAKGAA